MPPEVSDETRGHITELLLPGHLTEIPAWVEDLPNLKRLEVPYFIGTTLTIFNPSLESLHLSRGVMKTVEVPATAEVYCRERLHREPFEFPGKIEVFYRNLTSGEVVRKGPAIGHLYYTSNDNSRIDYHANLNDAARFSETGAPIVCRHLALEWVHQIQRHRATRTMTRFVDQWATRMDSPEKITGAVSPAIEDRIGEALRQSPEVAHVGDNRWGAFFRDEFTRMLPNTQKHFFVLMPCHAVSIELAVTEGAHGRRYVATLYDPNATLNRARIMENSLDEVESWCGETFMAPAPLVTYYGDEFAPRLSLFIGMPARFHRASLSEPLFDTPPASRTLHSYLADYEQANGRASAHLFMTGHVTADVLRSILDKCRMSMQKIDVLAGSSPVPNLLLATSTRDGRGVAAFCSVVIDEQREGGLTNAQIYDLFAERRGRPLPAFSTAMASCDDEVVRTYLDTFERLLMNGVWPQEVKMLLLKAPAYEGSTAFAIARDLGRTEAMRRYIDMLARLLAAGRLTREEFEELQR